MVVLRAQFQPLFTLNTSLLKGIIKNLSICEQTM